MAYKLTDADWKAAKRKWSPKEGQHGDACRFCEIYLWYGGRCRGCPLNLGSWRGRKKGQGLCHKLGHPWKVWFGYPSPANAKAVYDFLAEKYEEWKAKQH